MGLEAVAGANPAPARTSGGRASPWLMIDAAAIEITSTVAADHRLAFAGYAELVAAIDEDAHASGNVRAAHGRRAPAPTTTHAAMLSRSIRAGDAKATANDGGQRNFLRTAPRGAPRVSRLESSMPLGIRLGSSTTAAHHRTRQQGRARPRRSRGNPACQMPRLISAARAAKLGGDDLRSRPFAAWH